MLTAENFLELPQEEKTTFIQNMPGACWVLWETDQKLSMSQGKWTFSPKYAALRAIAQLKANTQLVEYLHHVYSFLILTTDRGIWTGSL